MFDDLMKSGNEYIPERISYISFAVRQLAREKRVQMWQLRGVEENAAVEELVKQVKTELEALCTSAKTFLDGADIAKSDKEKLELAGLKADIERYLLYANEATEAAKNKVKAQYDEALKLINGSEIKKGDADRLAVVLNSLIYRQNFSLDPDQNVICTELKNYYDEGKESINGKDTFSKEEMNESLPVLQAIAENNINWGCATLFVPKKKPQQPTSVST
eukprot:GHVR01000761.1.p1 GENE.GHVR01000761.1~~GHVR01000761.1.p1  ORF type:complete len:219 (+),score=33.05 GHVR01000761.1:238-894(+)